MIITCPHCQTKYQVTYEAIGSAGRKVQCAHCHQAWTQDPRAIQPDPTPDAVADPHVDAMAEDALDEAMEAEAGAVDAGPKASVSALKVPGIDAAELKKRQLAFARRQNAMNSSLPLARLRRGARVVGVLVLAGLVGGAYFGRVPIVERYPDLAGLYEAVGLGVNVVGLDFSNLETLKALSGGNDVLTVSAQIEGLSPRPVPVPPVVISLLDEAGQAVYEWSVTPSVKDLMAGERATFDTRLSLPPSEAVRVRLSFAAKGNRPIERDALPLDPPAAAHAGPAEAGGHSPEQGSGEAAAPEPTTDHAPAASAAHAPAEGHH